MAVVARKYKSRITFYAVNDWRGKQVAERIGPNQREAALRDRTMKKEIKAGTYQPPMSVVARTTGGYIESWLKERTNAYAPDERRMVKLYLEPREWLMEKPLDEVVPSDTDRLVKELRAEKKPDGSRRLSDKTIANVLGLMKQVFAAGIRADLCIRQPITLPPRTLKRTAAKEKEIYTPAEVVVLTRHHSIPWPIRVLNALAFFTGMREGEVCGRRWRDLEDASVLPAIVVRDQYEGRPLKTERPRVVPIHPELSKILTKWAEEGFELYTGRRPEPHDFIVPSTSRRRGSVNHSRSSYYKAFIKYAEVAGVRPRSLHSTRHTFITLAQRCGARKEHVERITHNARGDIVDRYTHMWSPLCEAMLCLNLEVLPDVHPASRTPGNSGGGIELFGVRNLQKPAEIPHFQRVSIPGASTAKPSAKAGGLAFFQGTGVCTRRPRFSEPHWFAQN
jgi:integrase